MAENHLFSNDPIMALHARISDMQRQIDSLRNSIAPRTKQYEFKAIADDDALVVTEGIFKFLVPHDVNRARLVDAQMYVIVASTSGKPTFQVRNFNTGFDMLLTPITLDINETHSYTAAIPRVINEDHNQVTRGQFVYVDCDLAGTGTFGLGGVLTFA